MNLSSQFEQELTSIGSGGAATLAVQDSPRILTCEVAERNALAVSFDRLSLATTELGAADAGRLERIGKALAEKLTYLMEPISPIEIDADACVVQLRSNPPQRDDDGRAYYELLIRRGGEITLRRYRKDNGDARRAITATVTQEVLLRLVGDFSTVVATE
jgi:hypothetical protein